jgi:hypothetical protein
MMMKMKLASAALLSLVILATQTGAANAQAAQRLRFAPGTDTVTRTGTLTFGDSNHYVIRLGKDDKLSVTANSANNNVILVIWGADGEVLLTDHADASSWSGVTPKTQDYFIDVRAIDGTSANYALTVTADPIKPNPPHGRVKRIVFPPGISTVTERGRVVPGGPARFVVKGSARQFLQVALTAEEQAVALTIYGADGTVLLSPMAGATSFSGVLNTTQDYFITVTIQGAGFALYTLTVTLESPVY